MAFSAVVQGGSRPELLRVFQVLDDVEQQR
jgi:hypothetical protein